MAITQRLEKLHYYLEHPYPAFKLGAPLNHSRILVYECLNCRKARTRSIATTKLCLEPERGQYLQGCLALTSGVL
jgi:hypothetical protein